MSHTETTTFGRALRMEREARKLTQTQLADMVGTSQQNIAGMEAGRSLPKEAIFDSLCEVFGKHSAVAQLPPRGVIKMGYDLVEDVKIKSATTPPPSAQPQRRTADKLSSQAKELAELFDMLPEDKLERVAAFRDCTGLLLDKIAKRRDSCGETAKH